ncbi:MAG: hypothetical protein Q4B50_00515 [Bacillota bacterium]|nr:hypothetical protein [Bacillota bacterium]
MITDQIIVDFRERVNQHDFVYNKYISNQGKNHWNCICSAMDWISVAVSYLQNRSRPDNIQNNHFSSIEIYMYISLIDMIFESVKQLHRVFVADEVVFDGVTEIFKYNYYCKDDNDYFKLIRACFGAHPVNLNDYFKNKKQKERRFASYSDPVCGNGDYGVFLYSSNPNEEPIRFDIYFDELNKFLNRNYSYLETLIQRIDEMEEDEGQRLRDIEIQRTSDACAQLDILAEENKRRYGEDFNSAYNPVIKELRLIFGTQITNSANATLVKKFREYLYPAIEELFECLQNMTHEEISTFEEMERLLHTEKHSVNKGLGVLASNIFEGSTEDMIWVPCLIDYISPYVELEGSESQEELYLLSLAGLYEAHLKKIAKRVL